MQVTLLQCNITTEYLIALDVAAVSAFFFRQNALDFNVQGRNEHTPLYVTAVEYFIVLYYNVHDSSVLACSVIIVRDKSEYVCNFAVLKCT